MSDQNLTDWRKLGLKLEAEINKIVDGSPMKKMTPLIAQLDNRVAAFMVAIAKKERDEADAAAADR